MKIAGLSACGGLMLLFMVVAGDPPPGINEAHYLTQAKNAWQPQWCANDLFVAAPKAHRLFNFVFGWPAMWCSMSTTAWLGRIASWSLLASGLLRLCRAMGLRSEVALVAAIVWLAANTYGHLAGEWVVGGVEAKVPAYGFVLLGLASLVQGRWAWTWLWFGTASAFHVLTGGWAVVAALGVAAWEGLFRPAPRLPRWQSVAGLCGGGLIALAGLIPAWDLSSQVNPAAATLAARIYVYSRLPHHLLPWSFEPIRFVRFGGLVFLAWWMLARSDTSRVWKRLTAFVIASTGITVAGLVLGCLPAVAPDLAARCLRFYWFRLPDVTVPLGLGLAVAVQVQRWSGGSSCNQVAPVCSESGVVAASAASLRMPGRVAWGILGVSVVLLGQSVVDRVMTGVPASLSSRALGWEGRPNALGGAAASRERGVMTDWLAVCRFVRVCTPPNEVFLTPRHQQTFKWYAHRAEVVNWKDVPQDAVTLQEWADRMRRVFPPRLSGQRVTIRHDELRDFRLRYGVRWMIVDRRLAGPELPLVKIYPRRESENRTYAIYQLP